MTNADLAKPTAPSADRQFVTVNVIRQLKNERVEFTVPTEHGDAQAAALAHPAAAKDKGKDMKNNSSFFFLCLLVLSSSLVFVLKKNRKTEKQKNRKEEKKKR